VDRESRHARDSRSQQDKPAWGKAFKARLAANGKPPKVIICAMMLSPSAPLNQAKCSILPCMVLDADNSKQYLHRTDA
jgi:hypothetical protein